MRGPAARKAGRKRRNFYEEIMNVVMTLQRDLLKFHARFEFGELSRLHMGVLGVLRKNGEMSVSAIAAKLRVSRPQMTPILDRLEELRLVRRGADASDRRVTTVGITDTGRVSLEAAMVTAHRAMTQRLSILNDEELVEFGDALRVMQKILAKL
jgi:MarR family transcriptional regulator, organic hydroperoxide resistance regulator